MGQRLRVFILGERVDRTELLPPSGEALDALQQRLPLFGVEWFARRSGLEL